MMTFSPRPVRMRELLCDFALVRDDDIRNAWRLLAERAKMIPSQHLFPLLLLNSNFLPD